MPNKKSYSKLESPYFYLFFKDALEKQTSFLMFYKHQQKPLKTVRKAFVKIEEMTVLISNFFSKEEIIHGSNQILLNFFVGFFFNLKFKFPINQNLYLFNLLKNITINCRFEREDGWLC